MGISKECRSEFVREMVKLSIHFAFRKAEEGASLMDVLTRQTPIYRLLGRWDGTHHPATGTPDSQWNEWITSLAHYEPGFSAEQRGLELLGDELEVGLERDLRLWPWIPDTYGRTPMKTGTYGFFLYELRDPADEQTVLHLHLGNALAPESPFADPEARARELWVVLTDARTRRPGLATISCESWLNHHPGFFRFFPPEWRRSARPTPMGYYFNWWGQFITRTGGFHFKNGDVLRQTGEFPFPCVCCRCSLDAFQAHLQKDFPK
jgi:hypothetical protein